MTICNMSIEGGARVGYVNPDETTFAFLKGRKFAPQGAAFDRAVKWWREMASDAGATYEDRVTIDASSIEPTVTWGINPGQSVGIGEAIGRNADQEALTFMGFDAGARVEGTRIDVAFIGSCTNGRLSDLEEAARVVAGRHQRPAVGSRRGRAGGRRPSCRAACEGTRRAGVSGGQPCGRGQGTRPDLHQGRLRMARRRLLDVPGDEPGQAGRPPGLRLVVEPELQGAPG
jgi:3-isopropylmalate/(R)-2-methylmalate dehydratase large subunit